MSDTTAKIIHEVFDRFESAIEFSNRLTKVETQTDYNKENIDEIKTLVREGFAEANISVEKVHSRINWIGIAIISIGIGIVGFLAKMSLGS